LRSHIATDVGQMVRAAPAYGATIAGKQGLYQQGNNRYETDAIARAQADIDAFCAQNKMTKEEFYKKLDELNIRETYSQNAQAEYQKGLVDRYEGKVFDEIDAWHSEHYVKSAMSKTSPLDDKYLARITIARAVASGGGPTEG
ncbi:MAG: hypothetical protein H7Z42_08415, partial [Roseiflexaceae bacterium]|nr:hypothetical protein [Roseiflexaceae bacterium]